MMAMERGIPVLEVRGLRKVFRKKGEADFAAVDGIDFRVEAGECVGLVGGSGCGKSTTAQMITGLDEATEGQVLLRGEDITHARGARRRETYRTLQMVFQNPAGSFDPRRTLGDGIAESLTNRGMPKREALGKARDLLVQCGLPAEFVNRYPRQVSGGQCQRAAIARALAVEPELIICDEATSALDVTVQEQIVQMLGEIKRKRGMALLFICHDLALVQGFCDRVLVMHQGRIVEQGPVSEVLSSPKHLYTRALLDAVLYV